MLNYVREVEALGYVVIQKQLDMRAKYDLRHPNRQCDWGDWGDGGDWSS